ncbi:unnamed protein product [Staurois parvus]|uniref:Uncharacterized protein n=1 Tax=Staurois parvus TaxID=386267 RepID=A0ABN9BJ76_9NEOB|nr:unnamed protein product [Staurois parvus]
MKEGLLLTWNRELCGFHHGYHEVLEAFYADVQFLTGGPMNAPDTFFIGFF